jgi:aminoglycoside 3-N-acetyltransferase
MANKGIKNRIMGLSPYVELCVRYIYWKNIGFFSGVVKNKKKRKVEEYLDFSKILTYLKSTGISSGDLLLVHSAYGELKRTQKKPVEIIQELKALVGENGTLTMPAIRKYEGEPDITSYVDADITDKVFTYDVHKSTVQTGALPATMVNMEEAVVSRFPLNTLVAIGPLAKPMMKDNLEGDFPTACGINSAWKFCLDNNAYIIGLGTDLTGCLTMIHVAEDVLDDKWPVKNWYRKRVFKIIDGGFETTKIIKERQPKWGTLHWAGRTLCKDLTNKKILHTQNVDGILVEVIKAKELIDFLNSKNSKGYPYFFVKKHLQSIKA